jgi:hypothetical protein
MAKQKGKITYIPLSLLNEVNRIKEKDGKTQVEVLEDIVEDAKIGREMKKIMGAWGFK